MSPCHYLGMNSTHSFVFPRPRLASKGARLLARVLDPLIGAVFVLVARAFGFESIGFALWTAVYLYFFACESQTPGKALVGIRIARLDGRPAGFFRCVVLREFALPLLCLFGALVTEHASPGTLGQLDEPTITALVVAAAVLSIVPILGVGRRCLHDYLAGTIVVKAE